MKGLRRLAAWLTGAALLFTAVAPAVAGAENPAVTEEGTIDSVQVNQVGYILGMEKTFAACRNEDDEQPLTFVLTEEESGRQVLSGTMAKAETPYAGTEHEWPQVYYTGDFTAYDEPGRYTVTVTCGEESLTSCSFAIGEAAALYDEPLGAILSYFRGERDTSNTQITNQFDDNNIIDLHGAWYDASNRPAVYMGYIDNYNYMVCCIEGNTGYQLFQAYEAAPEWYDAIDYNHNGVADILEEAVWGCDWYVRLKPQEVTGGYFYNGPEHGKIHTNESVKAPVAIRLGAGTAIAALAIAARYGIDGDFTAEEYGENAKQAWDWYIQYNETEACEDGMEHLMDDIYWAVAGLEMYKTFGDQAYLDVTIERVDAVLDRQTGDENFDGWFELGMEEEYDNTEGGPYYNWLDEAAVLYPLIGYVEAFPQDTQRVARIRSAVERYMDYKLKVANTTGSNPYGYAKDYYREEVTDPESTIVRFFQHENGHATSDGPNTKSWVSGENGRLLSLTYASLLAGEFLGTDKYLNYGLDQLNWVYGVNPYAAVMQCGIGEGRNLAEEIGHGGAVPYGGFINGIRGNYKDKVMSSAGYMDSRDYPFIDNSYWTGEWFLPIGTAGIMALTKLVALTGPADTVLPKDVPCEAEEAEYLLTTAHGSNKGNRDFEVMPTAAEGASGGVALTGIDSEYEGAIWRNAPAATSLTIRYAAEQEGSFHLFVGNEEQTIHLPATGGDNTYATVSVWAEVDEGDTVSLQYLDGDTSISLDYILFKDVQVTSVKHTLATTLTGQAPVMPASVEVAYSDGTSGLQAVEWRTPAASDYAQPGTFTLTGVLPQLDREVQATVTVYDIGDAVWLKPAAVATPIGEMPTLPQTVTAYYPDGGALELPVDWEAIPDSALDTAGKWEGTGAVEGIEEAAAVTVTVLAPFPEGTSDLAYGKRVSASSSDSLHAAEHAVDGDRTTRWASVNNNGQTQWFEVDLGKSYHVGSAIIEWESAFAKAYRIQISEDRDRWTTLYETDSSDGGLDEIAFTQAGTGRYLRVECLEYGITNWNAYSFYELRVYGEAGAADYHPAAGMEIVADTSVLDENGQSLPLSVIFRPDNVSIDQVLWSVSAPDGSPTQAAAIDYTGRLTALQNGTVRVTAAAVDGSGLRASRLFTIIGQSGGNLALEKEATAQYTGDGSPLLAVDGDLSTRYGGKYNENDQWFQVDLGEKQPVNQVIIRWESAYASAYELLVSNDNESWTPVYTTASGTGGVESIGFETVEARYVRVHSTATATTYGISIWEFEVYYAPDESASASDVAAVLENWPSPMEGAEALTLPRQEGFDVSILSSSDEGIVSKDGCITLPAEDTQVTLEIAVNSQQNPEDTATRTVTVTVPGVGETWAALQQELNGLDAFEKTDAYRNGSPEALARYEVARSLAQQADRAGKEAQGLMELTMTLLTQAKEALKQEQAVEKGDVDGENGVTAADALLALQAATQKITLSAQQIAAADVDGIEGVTASDALMILQYATQKIQSL